MERLTYSQAAVEGVQAEYAAGVAAGQDNDLTDRIDANGDLTDDPSGILVDRRDRPHVAYYQDSNGHWLPTTLKPNDDVMLFGLLPGRVIGPARGREWIALWVELSEEAYDHFTMTLEAVYVTDRAPVDPLDLPAMPIIPDEEVQRLMTVATAKKAPSDKHYQHDRDQSLRAAIASLPPKSANSLRSFFRKHGLLVGK